jgi:hypothetical protein
MSEKKRGVEKKERITELSLSDTTQKGKFSFG